MKHEVHCPSCGRRYRVDEARIPAGGVRTPCQACGAWITLLPRQRAVRIVQKRAAPAGAPPPEIVCPRCGLHFAADRSEAAGATARRDRVLLVEDLPFFQEVVRAALEPRFEVLPAASVKEARRLLRTQGADLILLDISLQGEDGLALLHDLHPKPCPVLVVTSGDESEMYGQGWSEMKALGADDVLVKSMKMGDLLVRKVSTLLGRPADESATS